jgi:anti-sigma factor RsiW
MNHLDENEITAYVDGGLTADRRAILAAHLDGCAECRAEVGDVVRLLRAAPLSETVRRRHPRFTPLRAGIGVAIAASLTAVVLLDRQQVAPPPAVIRAESSVTTEARAAIPVISPAAETASPETLAFAWHSTAAAYYRFTLTTAEGAVLATQETADTALTLPAGVTLEPGRLYFWSVDAIGNGITASTGMQRLTIAP